MTGLPNCPDKQGLTGLNYNCNYGGDAKESVKSFGRLGQRLRGYQESEGGTGRIYREGIAEAAAEQ